MEYKYHYIYKTTCLINQKVYIGQHKSNIEPINDRYIGSGVDFSRDLKEFRRKSFSFEILEYVSRETLSEREKYWVSFYSANNPLVGYNKTSGGNSNYEYTPEVCKKIKEKVLKYHQDNPNAGKKQGQSTREFYIKNPEAREEARQRTIKQFSTPESHIKHSQSQKKRFEDPRERKKSSQAKKKHLEENPELIEKFIERNKDFWSITENKERASKEQKEKWSKPGAKEAQSLRTFNQPIHTCICGRQVKGNGNFSRHKTSCKELNI